MIKVVGIDKAREIAIQMVRRNMSIYKLVYQTAEWYLDIYYRTISYFDYYFKPDMQNPAAEHNI
jgi:hypothetical protein